MKSPINEGEASILIFNELIKAQETISELKQHLNAVITAHEKMRKQYHIKEQSNVVTEAKKHLKSVKS